MTSRHHNELPCVVAGLGGVSAPRWLTSKAIDRVEAAEQRPFDDAEYEARVHRVRQRMVGRGLDALVVFRPSSIEYLCGYHTAETAPQPLLVTESAVALYVPDLELGRALASARVDQLFYCAYTEALQGLRQFLDHAVASVPDGARVGIETRHTSTPPRAIDVLASRDVTLVDADYLVERERLVLSPAEIGCVERAALVTQAGVEAAVGAAAERDATDSSVAAVISAALFAQADSASAWGPVVVTGNRAGIPHSNWRQQPLTPGATFMEFAGAHHRYHAPVMRTVVVGQTTARDRHLAKLAQTAVAAVLDNAKPGVPCSQVAARAAQELGPLPDEVVFHNLFGYPVGLAHKPHWMDGAPFHITADNHEPLQEGMVFHVPGSFRAFGLCGVGLSQTFVIDPDGARVLTHGPADVIHVGE